MSTDSQLQSDVQAQLKWQPSLNTAHLGVTAENGVVTLTGQVAHYAQQAAAEETAKKVYGVRAVANDITVELLDSSRRTDADIAAAALSALKWDFEVPSDKVKVLVSDGFVTLEGMVDWSFQKDAAKRCVQYLMGVKSVSNLITLKPTATAAGVKSQIEDAFRRHAELDARRIAVTTSNGEVTLRGSVASWSERDEAEAAAWAAPGVNSVDDQLLIAP